MAKMITRSILGTKASVITVDTISMTASTMEFTISGEWTDNNKLLKALKKIYETDTLALCSVVKAEKTEKLYGMTEELFMANAVELDPVTRKPIGTAEPQAEPTAEPQAEPTAEPQTEPTAEPQNGMTITPPVTITEVKVKASKIKK